MLLENKIAIVTGGAFGIGSAITRKFIAEGAKVLFVDIRGDDGKLLQDQLGSNAVFLQEDLTSDGMAERVLSAAKDIFGGELHVLVNNAQASKPQLLLDADWDSINLAMNTGLWATFNLMRACHAALAESRGSIINLASGAGLDGMATHGAYAMSKEAIRGLTRTAANEWGKDGIRANVICPAAATPGWLWYKGDNPQAAAQVEASIPLGRMGDAYEDVAPVAVFLASDASRYMTGQTLMADGGAIKLR